MSKQPFENVTLTDAAMVDLAELQTRSPTVFIEVWRCLKRLSEGNITPVPLRDFGKTGDLTDCGKIVVALEGEPEHRIVVRDLGGYFAVAEVIAVGDRTGDLPYLLAAVRLERLEDPVRQSDALRRIVRIKKSLGRPPRP